MIVLKFGGTSVSTPECLRTISDIVTQQKQRQPVVVVSAIRGVTDLLLSLSNATKSEQKTILQKIEHIHNEHIHNFFIGERVDALQQDIALLISELKELIKEKNISLQALQDSVSMYGELMSSRILAEALRMSGIDSVQCNATELIVTDDTFGSAEFIPNMTKDKTKNILLPLLDRGIVPVITGFCGATVDGRTTTLGRGGSDYSAAIIGFSLNVDEIQIWTDVDGIYSADPRVVASAKHLPTVSYREASELAAFGAKVLHPRTIRPAMSSGIPVRVCNTLNAENEGTEILPLSGATPRVSAVASKKRVMLINLYSTEMLHSKGFLERIFGVFAKYNISVDLVSVSEVSVSVTLDNGGNIEDALLELDRFTTVTTREVGMVSLIGEEIGNVPSLMRFIFSLLEQEEIKVHMISLGASEINISLVIDKERVAQVVRLLHDNLIGEGNLLEGRYL